MRPTHGLTSYNFNSMEEQYYVQLEDEILGKDWLQCYATEILDAKYEWNDVKDIVKRLTHLTQTQQNYLLEVLEKHTSMFDGSLGVYPHKKFHIDINLMQNQYTLDHTRYLVYICQRSRKNLTIWWNLVFLFLKTKANGHWPPSLSLKRMDKYTGSATYVNSIKC